MTRDRSQGSAVGADSPLLGPAESARAWRAGLPPERRRRSDLRGGLFFAAGAVAYVLTFVGAFRLPMWWLQGVCLLANPLAIGALFVVAHDACHGSLVRTGWLNRLLGRVSLLPAWHPVASWVHVHHALHHRWTNFKGRDAFSPFTKTEFDRLPLWRRLLERFYRSPLGAGVCYATDLYLKHLLFPRGIFRPSRRLAFLFDRLQVAGFLALEVAAAVLLVSGAPDPVVPPAAHAAAVVLLPWALWVWFMGFVTYNQHTHPRLPWYDDERAWSFYHVQLTSTAHVVFPWPIERLLNNITDHPAHHIDPAIPLYELPDSQRRLEQECPAHAVVVRWTPGEYLRTCAACKLYDFGRGCWTDFSGRPTGPRLTGAEAGGD